MVPVYPEIELTVADQLFCIPSLVSRFTFEVC